MISVSDSQAEKKVESFFRFFSFFSTTQNKIALGICYRRIKYENFGRIKMLFNTLIQKAGSGYKIQFNFFKFKSG